MYTLHRMYQRLLHPTKLYQAAHTVPLVYLYIQVHFLPVIYIPSTSRLSTEWTLKAPCTFPTRAVHTHSSTKLLCMIATTSILTIFSTKLSCTITTCFLHTQTSVYIFYQILHTLLLVLSHQFTFATRLIPSIFPVLTSYVRVYQAVLLPAFSTDCLHQYHLY